MLEKNLNTGNGTAAQRPKTFQADLTALPTALAPLINEPYWVNWKWVQKSADKWTKKPLQSCGGHAATDNPATWATYASVLQALNRFEFDGIGFCLCNSAIGAIDLDDCRDLETGTIASWAQAIIDRAPRGAYVEVTVSGTGFRIIGTINGAGELHRKFEIENGAIELFRHAVRFITISGSVLRGGDGPLVNIDTLLDELLAEHDRANKQKQSPHSSGQRFNESSPRSVEELMQLLPTGACFIIRTPATNGEHRGPLVASVTSACQRAGFSIDETCAVIAAHPDGIGARYAEGKNLRADVERMYGKWADHNAPNIPRVQLFSAADLQHKTFPPISYVVPSLIPEGLTILAARPKIGKSWLAYELATAIAAAISCLSGKRPDEGDVLYAALEDNERRLKYRMNKLLEPIQTVKEWPKRLQFALTFPRLDKGGLDDIERWADTVDKPKLVILDTLARVKPLGKRDGNQYHEDYESLAPLQRVANDRGLGVLLVHHQRKTEAEDPLDTISGTLGLAGVVDTALVITRSAQGTTLYVRGRDIEEAEYAINFDKASCRWAIIGNAEEVHRSNERQAILTVLRASTNPMRPSEIAAATKMKDNNIRYLLSKMAEIGEVIVVDRGHYIAGYP